MKFSKKKKAVALSVLLLVMVASGGAYAFWPSRGSGSATSKALTAQDLTTIDVSASTPETLYPGATGLALISISNPNPYDVQITEIHATDPVTVDRDHESCIKTAGITFKDQSVSINVPAGGTAEEKLVDSVTMSKEADDSCQGATFTIPVAFSGTQV